MLESRSITQTIPIITRTQAWIVQWKYPRLLENHLSVYVFNGLSYCQII